MLCPAVPRCAGIVATLLLCVAMPLALSLLCPAVPRCAGIVVTLFLSMAAVQFVIQEGQPASSYILPTQVTSHWSLASGVALACMWGLRAVRHLRQPQPAPGNDAWQGPNTPACTPVPCSKQPWPRTCCWASSQPSRLWCAAACLPPFA